MALLVNSNKHLRINTNPPQTSLKKRGGNISKLILPGQHYPDTKTRQGCHKKRKLQANITDEHRHKNLQKILAN